MNNKKIILLGIFGILLLNISSMAFAQDAEIEEQKMMSNMVAQEVGAKVVSFEKRNIVDNVYEYTWTIKVGKGIFDIIGVHRVVKEKKPWRPIKTKDAVMMVHGDVSDFRTAFLAGKEIEPMPDNQSSAVYLAEENIDVWGIDERWTFIPTGFCKLTGCKFMKNWDTSTHIKDIRTAAEFANSIRKFGSGKEDDGKMAVLGYSGGGQLAIALANQEAEAIFPEKKKIVGKLIIWDMIYKYDSSATIFTCTDYLDPATCGDINAREVAAANYQALKDLYNSGVYYIEEGFNMNAIAFLAENLPEEPSPFDANFTNWQMAMTVLSMTYLVGQPPASFYHYNAGIFDQNGVAIGLNFTNPEYMIDIAMRVPPYQSLGELIDREAIAAGENTPYDDHLPEITVPTCYFGAGGGMGSYGIYSIELFGSKDKEVHIISILPERQLDFGHADLGYAENARELVWEPTAKCIKKH